MPQGVVPPAQLPTVPSTRRPVGSALVCSSRWPAAGPSTANGVVAVMRRFRGAPWTYLHGREAPLRRTSTTDMPWAAMVMRICSGVREALPVYPRNISSSLVYSLLATSTAWLLSCVRIRPT